MPHAGIAVYAFSGTTYSGISGTTDANGQVSLTLPAGSYHFRADFNGTQFWDSTQNDCTVPGCTSGAVTVTNGVLVTVQNTDGTPQSGLKVYAYNGSTYTGYSGTTSASGQVTMTLPQGSYRFRADLNGTQFWDSAQNDCTIPGCGSSSITVTKPMTLTVQDTDGTLQSGLKVYAYNATTYAGYSGTTNASGQAVFTLPQGSYRFRADLNGTQFWSSGANDCTLPGCSTDQVTVTKPVTVTVQNAAGTPQSGLKVYAFSGSTYSGYSGTSDANGNVIFTLPQGSYRFRADFNGTQYWSSASNNCMLPGCGTDQVIVGSSSTPTASSTTAPTNTSAPIPSNTPTPALTNTSAPAPSSTPIPASTNTPAPSNTPLPAPTNTALPTNTSAPTSTQSGFAVQNQGALNIVPQSWFVQAVYKPGSSHRILADQSTGTPAPASTPTATSTAVPPTNTPGTTPSPTLTSTSSAPSAVSVTVQDTNNAPQSGLKVYAFNGSTYTGHSGTTDSNGQVIFTLPQGSYRFRADFNGTQFWSNAQNDCTIPGCTSDSITVTLPVTITVQDTDGTAKSGLPVYAFTGTTYTGHKSTTDSNGQVSLTLPQGSYRFRADLNGTQFWSSSTNTCTLPGCATASITVTKPLILTVQGQTRTALSQSVCLCF